jgi:hypothetical protein
MVDMLKVSGTTKALDPAVSEIFLDGAIRLADTDYGTWMRLRPATTRTIEKTSLDPAGAYSALPDGADFDFAAPREGNAKTYTQSTVALAFQVSAEAYHFLDKISFAEFVQSVGASAGRKLSSDAYSVLSGGFTDTGPDGVALFSAAHTAQVGGNQSNTGSTALAEASLQSALTTLRRLKTPDNILAQASPSVLVVPPELEYDANELVNSVLSGADNQINHLSTKGLTVVTAPDLSDANDWMLLDPIVFRAYMYVSKMSSPKMWIDQDSDNLRLSDRIIFATGYDGWRGAFGASVA